MDSESVVHVVSNKIVSELSNQNHEQNRWIHKTKLRAKDQKLRAVFPLFIPAGQ
jgi:hypothetical protein